MKKLIFLLLPMVAYTQSGKVGINTPQPTATLDVNGDTRIRNVPQGLPTDSLLVIRNGYIKKIAITSISTTSQGVCPNFIKNQSNPHYLLFSSTGSIPNPGQPIVVNNINFTNAGNWISGNTYYYSWSNVSGQPMNANNFTINFGGSLLCNYVN